MPEYPKLTEKSAERLLLQNGFSLERQKGSHRIYLKNTCRMIVPYHAGEILHPKIIKQLFEVIDEARLG
ncbi:MAG: addiction module toxin, HicA family [Methylobacter sp.]|nr:MAG: addiction module toxin, HicA family [Methylobacter sp.]